jgi:hypothetical protein
LPGLAPHQASFTAGGTVHAFGVPGTPRGERDTRLEIIMKQCSILIAVVILISAVAHGVIIGYFPGLDKLIEEADAIVILRVDKQDTDFGSPTLYSTHDCYVYQTLKGDIPVNTNVRFRLMDTRAQFVTP